MATAVRWDLVADASKFTRGFKDAEKATSGFTATAKKAGGVLAGAFAGGAVLAGIRSTIKSASDLNESVSKSKVVFGASAKEVEKFAAGAAKGLGQSKQEAIEAAGTLGNLFVSMKIGQPAAAKMSTQMVQLASDLASFNNSSPQEALDALRSGLVGETEPLRRFGINLSDAALRAEVMRLGLGKVGPTLTANQKAQASYSLILQQSKTAQGDFARTSDGLANQQRILAAQVKDASAAIGNVLLPVMITGTRAVTEHSTAVVVLAGAVGVLAVAMGSLLLVEKVTAAWTVYRDLCVATRIQLALLAVQEKATAAWTTASGVTAAGAAAGFKSLASSVGASALALSRFALPVAAVAGAVAAAVKQHKEYAQVQRELGTLTDEQRRKAEAGIGPMERVTAKQVEIRRALAEATKGTPAWIGTQAEVEKATKAWQEYNKTNAQTAPTVAKTTEEVVKAQAASAASNAEMDAAKTKLQGYKDGITQVRESIASTIPVFEGYRAQSDITATQIIRNLRQEAGGYATWAADTQALIKRGADPAFIKALSEKGPQYVHAMATGSNRELTLAEQYFKERMAGIKAKTDLDPEVARMKKQIAKLQEEINKLQGKTVVVTAKATFQPPAGLSMHDIVGACGGLVTPAGILRRARGGPVWGAGTSTSDSIPARLSHGEYVIQARAARAVGRDALDQINQMGFAAGGLVDDGISRLRTGVVGTNRTLERASRLLGREFAERVGETLSKGLAGLFSGAGTAVNVPASGNRSIVHQIFSAMFGWSGAQLAATDRLLMKESGYRNTAQNPTSTAFGMFQFLNGTWAGVGGHKTADPRLQAIYGGRYIRNSYGTPSGALAFHLSHGWYDSGGWLPPGVSLAVNNTGRPERVLGPGDRAGGARVTVDLRGATFLGGAREIAERLAPELAAALRAEQRRRGVAPAAQLA